MDKSSFSKVEKVEKVYNYWFKPILPFYLCN